MTVGKVVKSSFRVRAPAGVAVLCLGGNCMAQSIDAVPRDDDSHLQEITVTAQRREESAQKVPIAITAFTTEQLAARGLTDTTSLEAAVPNLTMSSNGDGATANPFLRGVGTQTSDVNSEQSVAIYVDGVYIATPIGNMFSFNNIERIEVLKGPQGTLFGRNATGGVIQLVTRDPKQAFGGEASVGYGNYDTTTGSLYATGGLTSNLAADIAVYANNRGEGLGHNVFNGEEIRKEREFSGRSKWLLSVGDATQARLTLDYTRSHMSSGNLQIPSGLMGADGSTYPGLYNENSNLDNRTAVRSAGAALRIDHDLGFARFASTSAYRNAARDWVSDGDATPTPFIDLDIDAKSHTFSQELQLLAAKDSAIDWLLGAYYFDADYFYDPSHLSGDVIAPAPDFLDIYAHQGTRSYSIYGQATYEIAPRLKLTGGLRDTWEKVRDDGSYATADGLLFDTPPQSDTFTKPTWRLALDYQVADSVLAYVSGNRGVKSGGFNLISPEQPGYRPEVLDAYEVGLKTEILDHRLRLNVAAFYYDYKDIQVSLIEGSTATIVNAAAATMKGIDLDFQAVPFKNFTLSGGLGLLTSEYTDYKDAVGYSAEGFQLAFDATGNRTTDAPKFTGSLSASYLAPTSVGNFTVNGTVIRNSGYFISADNRPSMPAYTLLNSSIGWRPTNGRVDVTLWVKNATDERYFSQKLEQGFGDMEMLAEPRTFGVTVVARF